ncbi:MAG: PAS domain S-box protein, partial [Actinomycetes bacterium]
MSESESDAGSPIGGIADALWDMPMAMFAVAGRDGFLLAVSPTWQQVLGYSPQELTSRPYLDYVHPDDVAATATEAQALLDSEHVTVNFENRYRCKDGSYRWLSWVVRANDDRDKLFAIVTDVTDEVAGRRELADSERRYRLLAENASDVVMLGDQQMNIRWVSDSVSASLGWAPEQLVGHRAGEFIHPDDFPALAAGIAGSAAGQRVHAQYRWLCADGSWRWMSAVGSLVTDDGGNVLGRVAGLRDVHDQVLAQNALADSEHHFRILAENATDVVWQLDGDGVLLWVSSSVEQEWGWRPEQLVGTNVRELIHPDDRAATFNWKARLAAGVEVPTLESRRLAADGSYRWVSLRGRMITGADGFPGGLIVGMRDIHDEVTARASLAHAVEHDPLTGLATLSLAMTRIQGLLTEPGPGRVV